MNELVFRLSFWVNLALVISTTYIITCYIFTPSNNQCQMTFMMEPPKFLAIPIDIYDADSDLQYPKSTVGGSRKTDRSNDEKYTLYLYSEFGYPQASNIGRDLRDSMPVLFVPGNAGSYQQVRSLASTSIRRQLQSLDAYKFAFYTIDFKNQLSGISSRLIEEQTLFVDKALKQIRRMHPPETGGVFVIGHSVGGFISKYLFTTPNFDPDTVPLLISLASPLTMPYLSFDSKMLDLYRRTNQFWVEQRSKSMKTIAISISGGRTDRLVPMHLSMDPHYDLSLTTSSTKEVWLPTDHVCITWCRELMNKLSHMMSATMDKRFTRLVEPRHKAISVIKSSLLLEKPDFVHEKAEMLQKNWKCTRPHSLVALNGYLTITRTDLSDGIVIVDLEASLQNDLMILIEHIEAQEISGAGLFACRNLSISGTQINCAERLDLSHFASKFPSQKYESKKTVVRLPQAENPFDHLILDYKGHKQGFSESKLPETVTIQESVLNSFGKEIYIPTLVELVLKKIFFLKPFRYIIDSDKNYPINYEKIKLLNLRHNTQIFNLKYEASDCNFAGGHSRGSTILFYRGKYLSESYHAVVNGKTMSLNIRLDTQPTLIIGNSSTEQSAVDGHFERPHLELYLDGACKHRFAIEFDLFNLVVNNLHKNLAKILTCSTYLALFYIVLGATRLLHETRKMREPILSSATLAKLTGFNIVYYGSDLMRMSDQNQSQLRSDTYDTVVSMIIFYTLCSGTVAFVDYFSQRLVDLAIIINNIQLYVIGKRVTGYERDSKPTNGTSNGNHGDHKDKQTSTHRENMAADFDWILIGLAISGSVIFSTAIISAFAIFLIMKVEIDLQRSIKELTQQANSDCCSAKSDEKSGGRIGDECGPHKLHKLSLLHNLLSGLLILNSLTLLSNIPSTLLKLNSNIISLWSNYELSPVIPILSLVLMKITCRTVDTYHRNFKTSDVSELALIYNPLFKSIIKYSSIIGLGPIILINSDLSQLNSTLLIALSWLNAYLFVHDLKASSHSRLNGSEKRRMEGETNSNDNSSSKQQVSK